MMGAVYLGPLDAQEIEEIKRALEAQLESIDDLIENGQALTAPEAVGIAVAQARIGRLLSLCETLALSE